MKIPRFLFRDFGRKLVALIFAVGIYWQISDSSRQDKPTAGEKPRPVRYAELTRKAAARIIVDMDDGRRRMVDFDNDTQEIKATFFGKKEDIDGLKDEDVLFYVLVKPELESGKHELPVECKFSRAGIEVRSIKPEKKKISIFDFPE